MWINQNWTEYRLLDCSDGERLEQWGDYVLIRPDPQVIWKNCRRDARWEKADASYRRSRSGGGAWSENRLPESWNLHYRNLTFKIRPMGFKHTGLFPEQAVNWDWMTQKITNAGRPIRVLNLFAYTGGATVAAAKAGASVCHVDAAKGMVAQAKENAALSGLGEAPIRYIVDDCKKFVEREIRRGSFYDGIVMDPPSYGRGPGGEVWKIEDSIDELVALVARVLSDTPLFFLLNSYTTGLSPLTMQSICEIRLKPRFGGAGEAGELALQSEHGILLPAGSSVRYSFS